MPTDPNETRTAAPDAAAHAPTAAFDPALDAGLAAAFGPDATPGGWSQPPLLRDDPSDGSPVVQPSSPEVPRGPADRYQLLGEIARGGMGVVLKGRDPDLGRDLAFKVLRSELAGRPAAVQRFVEEAQVGGQLQHPGVVPVYDLGRFPDGRPYFAMKLVKGRTLADLLAERRDPADDRGRFLRHFLQVCQTVAYAHSRGVVHRDLKPSNVMVGAFDEVLVMDWGLAKVLPRGGVADEQRAGPVRPAAPPDEGTEIRTARAGSGSETEAGSVLGTPAFMPPEQAGGETERLDERADVFGLGAVLCVVLTGSPPYVAPTPERTRLLAVRGDLAACHARLDACGADAELVALAKRCLAPDRDARPRHAGEVAAAVSGHLSGVEDRARRAEVDRAAAEARATEEANTRRVAEAKVAEERRRRRTQLALVGAVGLLLLGGGAFAWWQGRMAELAKLTLSPSAERASLDAASTRLLEQQNKALWAAKEVNVLLAQGLLDKAIDELREAARLDPESTLPLRTLAGVYLEKKRDVVAAEGAWREALRRAPADPQLANDFGCFLRDTGRTDEAMEAFLTAARLDPKYAMPHWNLAGIYFQNKHDLAAAEGAWREALRRSPEHPQLVNDFGCFLRDTGRTDEAIHELREGARVAAGSTLPLRTLAGVYLEKKRDVVAAEGAWREALRRAPWDSQLANDFGCFLRDTGRTDEALKLFRTAAQLAPGLGHPRRNEAWILHDRGDTEGAARAWAEAVTRYPTMDAEFRVDYAGYLNRAWLFPVAIEQYRYALAVRADHPAALNELAWLRATCPDARFRDGREAVRLAARACEVTKWTDPNVIDTLAAAHAEAGEFDRAVEHMQRALALPGYEKAAGPGARARLEQYRRKVPYREPPVVVAPPPHQPRQ